MTNEKICIPRSILKHTIQQANQNFKTCKDFFALCFSTAPLFITWKDIGKRAKGRNKEEKLPELFHEEALPKSDIVDVFVGAVCLHFVHTLTLWPGDLLHSSSHH